MLRFAGVPNEMTRALAIIASSQTLSRFPDAPLRVWAGTALISCSSQVVRLFIVVPVPNSTSPDRKRERVRDEAMAIFIAIIGRRGKNLGKNEMLLHVTGFIFTLLHDPDAVNRRGGTSHEKERSKEVFIKNPDAVSSFDNLIANEISVRSLLGSGALMISRCVSFATCSHSGDDSGAVAVAKRSDAPAPRRNARRRRNDGKNNLKLPASPENQTQGFLFDSLSERRWKSPRNTAFFIDGGSSQSGEVNGTR